MPSKYKERVRIGADDRGDPIYVWACGNTKDELHRAIATVMLSQITSNKQVEPIEQTDVPLWEEYSQEWFDTFHLSRVRAKTVDKDRSLLKNHVRPAFEGMRLDSITPKVVQQFLQSKSQYSRAQIRDIMGMIRQIFALAVEEGWIARNPMDSTSVHNPSTVAEKERKSLSAAEQADIIAHIDDLKEPNARRLMALLMFTPLRPCEIYGLQWQDIDLEHNTIRIQRDLVFANGKAAIGPTKTKDSNRVIPLDDRLKQHLAPYGKDGFIICMTQKGREGEHLSSDSCLRSLWRRIGKTIDLHGMTPYVGRHTFATNMSRAGVPMKTAMAYMGHTDERMLLRRYTHVDQEDLVNASKTMSDYIDSLSRDL